MTKAGHTSVHPGKKVLVLMRNGDHFVAKFRRKVDRVIEFDDHGPVSTSKIRTLSIYKGKKR